MKSQLRKKSIEDMKVLVLGGITARASLAITRSLGSRGVNIEMSDPYRINPSRFSRYVSKFYLSPNPVTDPAGMAEWLLNQVKTHEYDAIFPLNDYTYDICTDYQEELFHYTNMLVNNKETYQRGRNKIKTVELVREQGIPHPKSWILQNENALNDALLEISHYPLVVKPAKSSGSRGLAIIHSEKELVEKYNQLSSNFGPMILQEYIPGDGVILDVTLLFNRDSEIRAAMVSNRIRMFPDGAGPNTAGHGVINPSLRDMTIEMMQSIGWKGMCQVEYKVDCRDNTPKLIEINPRMGGSTQLGVNAGLDWAYKLFQIIVEGDCEPQMTYRTDVLSRWLIPGELMHAITTKNKKKLWPDFFRFFDKNTKYYIFNRSDLGPVFGLFLTLFSQAFNPKMIKYYIFRNKAKIKKFS